MRCPEPQEDRGVATAELRGDVHGRSVGDERHVEVGEQVLGLVAPVGLRPAGGFLSSVIGGGVVSGDIVGGGLGTGSVVRRGRLRRRWLVGRLGPVGGLGRNRPSTARGDGDGGSDRYGAEPSALVGGLEFET